MMDDPFLGRARELVANAEAVVVLTGAGVSASSGVPTFRGTEGLWRSFRPEELATPAAFARDPELVWSWYAWRRKRIASCRPNPAHSALARFALSGRSVTLVTQNVDGLHATAAVEEARLLQESPSPALPLELHGSIFRLRCTLCSHREPHRVPDPNEEEEEVPSCPGCSQLLRPDVVWFGEPLPSRILSGAFEAAQAADLCLVVGTSAVVHPAASIPLATAECGGTVVEVNPEATPVSRVASMSLRGDAAEVIPALLEGL